MTTEEIMKLESEVIGQTFARYPVAIERGQGTRVWDNTGKEYLDFFGGLAVLLVGHCHPRVVSAVKEQAGKVMHTSNLFYLETQVRFAKLLHDICFKGKIFFVNTGAEANETAIKLTRKWAKANLGPNRYEIITFVNSFHGRTLATLTATGQLKFHKGLEPMMLGFQYAQYNDLGETERKISDRTAAIMVEAIQGEGGVQVGSPDFLRGLRAMCDKHKLLLIFDEVQTGLGRTGRMFACEHAGVVPDIITLAKGLGGGLPLGAAVVKPEVAAAFGLGDHGTTMGGNPVSCAAGLATLQVIQEENLVSHAEQMGKYLMEKLEGLHRRFPRITDVRGKGLLVGVEVEAEAKAMVSECRRRGVILNVTADKVIRFLPPLTVNEAEIDQAIKALEESLLAVE